MNEQTTQQHEHGTGAGDRVDPLVRPHCLRHGTGRDCTDGDLRSVRLRRREGGRNHYDQGPVHLCSYCRGLYRGSFKYA